MLAHTCSTVTIIAVSPPQRAAAGWLVKCAVFAASIEPDNDTFPREGGVWEGMIVPVYAHSPALMCPYFHGLRKSTSIGIMEKKKNPTHTDKIGWSH